MLCYALLVRVMVVRVVRIYLWAFVRWSRYHQLKTLLGGRQLREIVLGVGTANVLLHGAVALLLFVTAWLARLFRWKVCIEGGVIVVTLKWYEDIGLTPRHRLRHNEPS